MAPEEQFWCDHIAKMIISKIIPKKESHPLNIPQQTRCVCCEIVSVILLLCFYSHSYFAT